jgi:hypothetical protein
MDNLKEDREILRQFRQDQFPREGFDDTKFKYHCEYTGANGMYIWQAKSLGWEVVRGEMPENPGMRNERGECQMGDVVFMRMPMDQYKRVERAREALNRESMGQADQETIRREIDERISKFVGQKINVSFQFRDQRELAQKREG